MKVLITGGAGFIGTNAAEFYASRGDEVVLFDNLSRRGSEANLSYLEKSLGDKINFIEGDIRNRWDIERAICNNRDTDLILHLAAQVAVTTSVNDPREDFDINALGTFNVLEAMRSLKNKCGASPIFIYASTNKVYGGMEDVGIIEKDGRYTYENLPEGINEERGLDFHSPYGCSKGTGDQYVRDYSRIYCLDTIVMRQSCIYGERQFGVEDQGWLAWFTIAQALGKPITVYGDGKQVRDVLWVNDLIDAYEKARQNIEKTKGQIYNLGGGHKNQLSLLESFSLLKSLSGKDIPLKYEGWRPGDQKVCFMDISKAENDFKWKPTISPSEGMKKLYDWVNSNKSEIEKYFPN